VLGNWHLVSQLINSNILYRTLSVVGPSKVFSSAHSQGSGAVDLQHHPYLEDLHLSMPVLHRENRAVSAESATILVLWAPKQPHNPPKSIKMGWVYVGRWQVVQGHLAKVRLLEARPSLRTTSRACRDHLCVHAVLVQYTVLQSTNHLQPDTYSFHAFFANHINNFISRFSWALIATSTGNYNCM
jgi:hypothetical protein